MFVQVLFENRRKLRFKVGYGSTFFKKRIRCTRPAILGIESGWIVRMDIL